MLARLRTSAFRARFRLGPREIAYARTKGRATIERHAHELLAARVGPAAPANDGRQTPYRGHPVFVAQHATATCCRGCIAKWHGIPEGSALTGADIERLASIVMAWIDAELLADTRR